MKIVYFEKHDVCLNLMDLLQNITTPTLLRQDKFSFCLTKYNSQTHLEAQACICGEGFSIIQVTINLLEWKEFNIGSITVTPDILFEHGLLKMLVITTAKQLRSTQFPWKLKCIINSMMKIIPNILWYLRY